MKQREPMPLDRIKGMVTHSNEALYTGAELGPNGDSPFLAALTIGVFEGVTAEQQIVTLGTAAYLEQKGEPDARRAMIRKLREVLRTLEGMGD